ncbi:glucose-6-phosphate dehydrogenase [Chelativorans salis]|uniref:Glucose-6-phosphate 1-dehydrogenase n=1 Tax=Chelativorans salis TaxID=2978478 RepID=A0ABT2LTK9_9HYPH|nr:glucose-6-phosphate dehydrogenase [Chelativorans sp. EGI FJ00035]MCT7377871.1 glucose-6-phosphate dehydrogenase [Chelativorans sp. EGI FJ00035]
MSIPVSRRSLPADATPAPASTLVIFGASGDLTKRLLMPALYNLAREKGLDPEFRIIGVDHVERSEEEFRTYLTDSMHALVKEGGGEFEATSLDAEAWDWIATRVGYLTGDFEDPKTYRRLGERLAGSAKAGGQANAVFYLATAPRFFGTVIEHLGTAGLTQETDQGFRRIVVEKPFGTDLASAQALNRGILKVADESQLYRIDHFLGKETVQNIMVLRFANGIFEPIWNRDHIDHVQITAAETVGVEGRGGFYDATGALRDMVPNHMFQLLAMTAMEAPNSFDADAVRTEKAKVIEAVRRWSPEEAIENSVRGQYDAGKVRGRPVKSYRQEPDVSPKSDTETYVALKLMIDNWRWSGVPFYIRTGKSMAARRTEIAIQFKQTPDILFRGTPNGRLAPNVIVFRIQPKEGVSLRFAAKVPGRTVRLGEVNMDFRYSDYFEAEPTTGYETLIYDCLIGDPTLFQRADNIEAGWAAVQPFLDAWAAGKNNVHLYRSGGSGPSEADALMKRDGRGWLPLDADAG